MESKRSESIMNLAAALAVAQGQIASASKDASAGTKYKYATLDSIWEVARKPLTENGLSVIQIPTNDENGFYLETILLHSSGEWMSGQMSLPVVPGPMMNELQAMGSAITYVRRYMLGAMVGVTTGDDDDGQKAVSAHRPQPRHKEHKNGGMTLDKLFVNLNGPKGVPGFYQSALEIHDCRNLSAVLPDSDDIEGWRLLFLDAKNYALSSLAQEAQAEETASVEEQEDAVDSDQPELFGDDPPADDAPPGAYETE